MNFKKISLLTLALAVFSTPLQAVLDQKMSDATQYTVATQQKKYVIGICVRTSNAEGQFQKDVAPLWERFYADHLSEKIPDRTNQNLMVVYTDYEGDYTQPFTCLIGCEVANLKNVPFGMIGIEIPASTYAVFTAEGEFPDSLIHAWHTIWASQIQRAYTTDFEVYPADFDPQKKPAINVYIALQETCKDS